MNQDLIMERLSETAVRPQRAHTTDAGLDLFSDENLTLTPGQRAAVKIGWRLAIPNGLVGLIWDKSGLAVKNGLHCLAGVIDSGYRGELLVAVINLGQKDYQITAGQKIAQLLIQPVSLCQAVEGKIDDDTERGADGFGSTGQ